MADARQGSVLPRVLLIRGMNKLVLDRLVLELSAEMEFVWAPVPVPLIGLTWLRDPFGVPCLLTIFSAPVLLYTAFQHSLLYVVIVAVLLVLAVQVLARHLVRGLLPEAVRVASMSLQPHDGCCCAVGYSWGGGVLHHLVAEGLWEGPSLLLCPATTTMAAFAAQAAPSALRVAANVTVVGAHGDELCNAVDMSNFDRSGARVCTVNDAHTLLEDKSVQVVVQELRRLISEVVRRKKD